MHRLEFKPFFFLLPSDVGRAHDGSRTGECVVAVWNGMVLPCVVVAVARARYWPGGRSWAPAAGAQRPLAHLHLLCPLFSSPTQFVRGSTTGLQACGLPIDRRIECVIIILPSLPAAAVRPRPLCGQYSVALQANRRVTLCTLFFFFFFLHVDQKLPCLHAMAGWKRPSSSTPHSVFRDATRSISSLAGVAVPSTVLAGKLV